MSFPERLTLGHLIDGENNKDAVMAKEYQADQNYCYDVELSSPVAATTAAAVVTDDAGETVILLLL